MLRDKQRALISDNLKRSLSIKFRIRDRALRSLRGSKLVRMNARAAAVYRVGSQAVKYRRAKNICFLSGERAGVSKRYILSRFQINYVCISNKFTGARVSSW